MGLTVAVVVVEVLVVVQRRPSFPRKWPPEVARPSIRDTGASLSPAAVCIWRWNSLVSPPHWMQVASVSLLLLLNLFLHLCLLLNLICFASSLFAPFSSLFSLLLFLLLFFHLPFALFIHLSSDYSSLSFLFHWPLCLCSSYSILPFVSSFLLLFSQAVLFTLPFHV